MTAIVWIGTALLSSALIFQALGFQLVLERTKRYSGWDFLAWAMFILLLRRGTALYVWTGLLNPTVPTFLDMVLFPLAVSLLFYYGTLKVVTQRDKPGLEILSDAERSVEYRRLRTLVSAVSHTIDKGPGE